MKNSSDTMGNRTRDIPVCTAVPQPTAPPHSNSANSKYFRSQCIWVWYISLTSSAIKQVQTSYPAPPICLFLPHFLTPQGSVHQKWTVKCLNVISGFRCGVDEICVLLGDYAALSGNYTQTFRDNLSVPSSRVKRSWTS
jgi:hypothetical protein